MPVVHRRCQRLLKKYCQSSESHENDLDEILIKSNYNQLKYQELKLNNE